MNNLCEAVRAAFFEIPACFGPDGPEHGPTLEDIQRLAPGCETWSPPGSDGRFGPPAIACWTDEDRPSIFLLLWHTRIELDGPDRYWTVAQTWISHHAEADAPYDSLDDLEISSEIQPVDPRMLAWWFGVVEKVVLDWAANAIVC